MRKQITYAAIGFIALTLFIACAPVGATAQRFGFFSGIIHGMLFLPELIAKILGFSSGLYAKNNNGLPYWIGYFIGFFMLGFGSRFLK